MKLIDLKPGDSFTGYYLMRNIIPRRTKASKPCLSMALADVSASVESMVWDYGGPIGPADEGKVAWVQGVMKEYRGTLQITVEVLRPAEQQEYFPIIDTLVPTAPLDRSAAYARVEALVATLEDDDFRRVAEKFLQRHGAEFCRYPAAKTVHHGFVGGLLMHTADMLELADFLAGKYRTVIHRDLLLTGTLLHDIAKLREFVLSDLGVVMEYSTAGQLLGHLVMGAQEAAEVCKELGVPEEKSMLLQHLLLSHHGQPEFGAAVVPQCAEAELLASIDHIDSRMEIYRETLEKLQPGQFSQRVFALDRRIYRPNLGAAEDLT